MESFPQQFDITTHHARQSYYSHVEDVGVVMSFPVPPNAKPVTSSNLGNKENGQLTPQPHAVRPTVKGELSPNESEFILTDKLSRKHRSDPSVLAFIDSFIRCKNIAEASEEAGISPKLGYQYRHRSDIASAIQALIDRSAIKYGFDASEIVERTKEIVDFDPISMQNPDGTFKDNLSEIEPAARRNLKKLKVKNLYSTEKDMNGMDRRIIIGKVIEYEFYDKLKAVELVGREKDIFKNKSVVEHSVTKDMASFLLESAKRGDAAAAQVKVPRTIDVEVVQPEDEDGDI